MEENEKENMKKSIKKKHITEDNPERKGIIGALKINEPKIIEKEYDVEVYKKDNTANE